MKRIVFFLFLLVLLDAHGQSYTMCTSSFTLHAVNSDSLTNPTYSFEPGQVTNNTGSFVVSPATTTSYTLYVTGSNSTSAMVTTSTTATVHVIPPPTFSVASQNNFTLGCGTHSAGTQTIVPISPTAGVTYTWLPPGTSTTLSSPLSTVTVYTVSAAGSHTAVVREGVCGHETRFPVNFVMNTVLPEIDSVHITQGISCFHDSVIITVHTKAYPLTWEGPSTGEVLTGSVITVFIPGTYTVFGFDSTNGCPNQETVVVPDQRVYPLVQYDSLYSICDVSIAPLTVTLTNPSGHDSIVWYNKLGQIIAYGPTYTASAAGKYLVTVSSDFFGCKTNVWITVVDCSGLSDVTGNSFRFWPNPATEVLRVGFDDRPERTFLILSITGQEIKKVVTRSGEKISLKELSAGIYLLKSDGQTGRFVKE